MRDDEGYPPDLFSTRFLVVLMGCFAGEFYAMFGKWNVLHLVCQTECIMDNDSMQMLPCGITRGNNNIVRLLIARMPIKGAFNFKTIYDSIPAEDYYNAHGHVGSWASQVTGGVDVCYKFFKEEGFVENNDVATSMWKDYECKLTENGRLLKEKGDYEKYVDFILSEKRRISQMEKETFRMQSRQSVLLERQYWLNLTLAIGVIPPFCWYFLDILKNHYSHCLPLFRDYILPIGVPLGLILLILKLKLKKKS